LFIGVITHIPDATRETCPLDHICSRRALTSRRRKGIKTRSLRMWHWGDTGTLALTSTVGHAAARTVIDSGGPPTFSRYVDVGEAFRDAA
jgi:hypothetical protein